MCTKGKGKFIPRDIIEIGGWQRHFSERMIGLGFQEE